MFSTPILFIIFNRPQLTSQIFDVIKTIKPERLYLAADGPREWIKEDKINCDETRGIVSEIDWDCKVAKLFRHHNLGCKNSVSSAINWFFENEEEGIILEDDILPHISFFEFCETLLHKYANEDRIMAIGGTNILPIFKKKDQNYIFSYQGSIWGWATWRRAWEKYQSVITDDLIKASLENIRVTSTSKIVFAKRIEIFSKLIHNGIDSWGYHWLFSRLSSMGLTILPTRNLISNIGFGINATHTTIKIHPLARLPIFPMQDNPKGPKKLEIDYDYEICLNKKIYGYQTIIRLLVMNSKRILKLLIK